MAIKVARIITGAGVRHSLSVYGSDGSALDLTGATPRTITYYSPVGAVAIAAKTITLSGTPSVAPQGYVDIAASEYSSLTAYTSLYGQVSITLSTGKVHTEDFVQPIGPHEPVAGKIVQVSDLKEYLGITAVTDDNLLYECIDRAQNVIERYCSRTFGTATFTEDMDGTGTATLCVQNPPITSVTSVSSLSRESDGTETATALSAGSYRFDAESGVISLLWAAASSFPEYWSGDNGPATFRAESPRFADGFRNYRVVYVGGYTAATMPGSLKQACLEVATDLYRMRRINKGMQSESMGVPSYTAKAVSELVDQRAFLLNPFRMGWF